MNTNISIHKLDAISQFLKSSSRFFFQNYNLKLFIDFINQDPIFSSLLKGLVSDKENLYEHAKQYATEGQIIIENAVLPLTAYRIDHVKTFEDWVCFCYSYLENLQINQGDHAINRFIALTSNHESFEQNKLQFFNECVLPIKIYLTMALKNTESATSIIQRYKVLCEWYDREKLIEINDEVPITKSHLGKFLFDQGYTYSLSETNVPSGRIDNFATTIGLSRNEIRNLPEAIIAEGKIYRGRKTVINEVKNQTHRRVNELNFNDGYCVIYNITGYQILLTGASGSTNGFDYKIIDDKKIFFVIINLNDIFYNSTANIPTKTITLD